MTMTQTIATPWKVWKTISCRTVARDSHDSLKILKDAGVKMNVEAKEMLRTSEFIVSSNSSKGGEIDLVVMSVSEIIFRGGPVVTGQESFGLIDIYEDAIEQGLQLCPEYIGPQLRLQYPDQPRDEWVVIAMSPLLLGDDSEQLFAVGNGNKLDGFINYGGWNLNDRFVFALLTRD